VIEAGTYITAGSKVLLAGRHVVKARDLSGQSGLLFIRNSVTGALEVRPRPAAP
jgi:2,3,4,5-tetrahydropyridine-2-carboxylate N-succinyltransferase